MRTLINCRIILAVVIMAAFLISTALAEEIKKTKNPGELAKQSQNPVSNLISLPFENNATWGTGSENAFVNILNVKPVIPMNLTENWNLINRAILPIIYQGERFPDEGDIFGFGDIIYQGFFTPAKPGKVIWGIGPQLGAPIGMDRLSSNQWTLGPAAVVLAMPGQWVIGALVSNEWSIGGGYGDPPPVNRLTFQYFLNYNMPKGWYLTMAPVMTANWEAEDDGQIWTVPVGGGLGRVFKIGKQNVNAKLATYYNVTKPDQASEWNLQFSFTFLFPK